jgi:hypothetical protein
MSLLDLPPNIQRDIASHLELPALVKFASTNKHLKYVVDEQLLREKLQAYEEANPLMLTRTEKRPCYGCLRMRRDEDFYQTTGFNVPIIVVVTWNNSSAVFGVGDTQHLSRRCYKCDDQARFRAGRKLRPGMINGIAWPAPVVPASNGSSSSTPAVTTGEATEET